MRLQAKCREQAVTLKTPESQSLHAGDSRTALRTTLRTKIQIHDKAPNEHADTNGNAELPNLPRVLVAIKNTSPEKVHAYS
jgi:hypothetical protein